MGLRQQAGASEASRQSARPGRFARRMCPGRGGSGGQPAKQH
jgi:hypothetical protein